MPFPSRFAALVATAVLAGCTGPAPAPAPEPSTPTSSDSPNPSPPPPGVPDETVATEPLVLAVHATRPVRPLPAGAARRLLRQGASRWPAIGQGSGRMRVVTGGLTRQVAPGAIDATSAAALRRVRKRPGVLALVPASAVDARVRVLEVGGVHPLRSPQRYPLQIATGEAPGIVTTVTVVGDVMLGRRVGDALEAAGDPAAVLRPLAPRLSSADITVANLESTLSTNGQPTQGDDSFAAAPAVRSGLRLAGFDVLSLANNHVGDYGPVALVETLQRLSGFAVVGAGRNLRAARRPVVLERDGVRIGFLATDSIGESPAATARTPGTNRLDMPPRTGPLDRSALRRIAGDVRRLAARVDTVVVIPHWGTQYTHEPEPVQRRVSRVLAGAGADLVLGGHPHWVQGWEAVRGAGGAHATVVHSLGNFVFDMDFMEQTQEGVFVEAVLWDGRVMALEPVPYVIGADFAPRRATGAGAAAILSDVWSTSRGPWSVPQRPRPRG